MRDRAQPIANLHQPYASRRWFCFRFLWRSAMSKLGILGATALSLALAVATPAFAVGLRGVCGVDTMYVGSGFRIAQPSAGSAVSSADASHCRAALGVLRLDIREVYGRRWSVASLPVKAKKSGSGRSFLLDKLVLRFRRGSRRQARRGPSILWRPATPACSALEAGSAELGGIPQGDIFGCTGLIGQDVDTFSGPVLERH